MGVLPSDISTNLTVDGFHVDLDGQGGEAVQFTGDIFGDADDYNIGNNFQCPSMDAGNTTLHATLEGKWEPE
jgi:hypothetical protein